MTFTFIFCRGVHVAISTEWVINNGVRASTATTRETAEEEEHLVGIAALEREQDIYILSVSTIPAQPNILPPFSPKPTLCPATPTFPYEFIP